MTAASISICRVGVSGFLRNRASAQASSWISEQERARKNTQRQLECAEHEKTVKYAAMNGH